MTIPGTGPRWQQPEPRHVDGALVVAVVLGVGAAAAAVAAVTNRAWVLLALIFVDVLLVVAVVLLFAILRAVEALPRRSAGARASTPTAAGVPLPPRSAWPWST